MENSSIKILKFWACHRPISGMVIQNRVVEKIIFNEFRGVTQTDLWKIHPDNFQSIFAWMGFPEISLTRDLKIEILKKNDKFSNFTVWFMTWKTKILDNFWMSFPGFPNKCASIVFVLNYY